MLISIDKSVLCQSLSGTISSTVTFSYEVCVGGWVGQGEGLLLLCQDEHLSPYDRHIPARYLKSATSGSLSEYALHYTTMTGLVNCHM